VNDDLFGPPGGPPDDFLEDSFGYLSRVCCMAGAVLDVYDDNCARHQAGSCDLQAGADGWSLFDDLRRDVWQRSRSFWCCRSQLDPTWFPLSLDHVARLYFRIRKRNDAWRAALRAAANDACQQHRH